MKTRGKRMAWFGVVSCWTIIVTTNNTNNDSNKHTNNTSNNNNKNQNNINDNNCKHANHTNYFDTNYNNNYIQVINTTIGIIVIIAMM